MGGYKLVVRRPGETLVHEQYHAAVGTAADNAAGGLQYLVHQALDESRRRGHEAALMHQPLGDGRQAIAGGNPRVQEPTTAATSSDEVRKTLLVERSAILSMLSATSSTVGARPSMRRPGASRYSMRAK